MKARRGGRRPDQLAFSSPGRVWERPVGGAQGQDLSGGRRMSDRRCDRDGPLHASARKRMRLELSLLHVGSANQLPPAVRAGREGRPEEGRGLHRHHRGTVRAVLRRDSRAGLPTGQQGSGAARAGSRGQPGACGCYRGAGGRGRYSLCRRRLSTLAMASLRLFRPWWVSPPACADQVPCQFQTRPITRPSANTSYSFAPVLRSSTTPPVYLFTVPRTRGTGCPTREGSRHREDRGGLTGAEGGNRDE